MNDFYESEVFENVEFIGDECNSDEFEECLFKNCTIEESFLNNCCFTECHFENCTIRNMTFKDCQLFNCSFVKCNLIGINWDDFIDGREDLASPFEKLESCLCKFNSFSHINFIKFKFKQSEILESSFLSCNFKDADLSGCNLEKTTFAECNLTKCDLRNTSGWEIPLALNCVKGAQFSFPEVVNLLNGTGIKWE